MKNATAYAKKLGALLRKLTKGRKAESSPSAAIAPLEQLVVSFLQWETTRRAAETGYARLLRRVVDFNDLRVSDPRDIADALGARYARAEERARLLQRALHAIFLREHCVSLDHIQSMSKRDARAYLDKLDGMVPFVSASVVLYSLGGHAIPVDELMLRRLKHDGIVDDEATVEQAQAFLEHQIKAADGLVAFEAIREHAEKSPGSNGSPKQKSAAPKSAARKKAAATRKSSKKTKSTTKKKSSAKSASTRRSAQSSIAKKSTRRKPSKK